MQRAQGHFPCIHRGPPFVLVSMPPRAIQAPSRTDGAAIPALGVLPAAPIHVSSEAFEGSLASLFALVRDHRIDLMGVPLFPICEAYFEYLITATESDLDEAAVALSALSYLLERKAWLLLPAPEVDPEPFEEPTELPEPSVIEFRAAIDVLGHWHDERADLYFRSRDAGPNLFELPYELADVSGADLARALDRVLQRAKPTAMPVLARARRSLAEQMELVFGSLKTEFQSLTEIIHEDLTRSECVYWFLAILELVRLGRSRMKSADGDVLFARSIHPQAKLWSEEALPA